MEIGPDGKPCKACVSVEEMMKRGREMAEKLKEKEAKESEEKPRPSGYHGCPVDKDEMGRSTWNLLHSMSVYYPEKPSESDKQNARNMMTSMSRLYPCSFCAEDLRKDLKEDPPKVDSREAFSQWMCLLHNKVNKKTGKPEFDCKNVMERWKDGWKNGSCDY